MYPAQIRRSAKYGIRLATKRRYARYARQSSRSAALSVDVGAGVSGLAYGITSSCAIDPSFPLVMHPPAARPEREPRQREHDEQLDQRHRAGVAHADVQER